MGSRIAWKLDAANAHPEFKNEKKDCLEKEIQTLKAKHQKIEKRLTG